MLKYFWKEFAHANTLPKNFRFFFTASFLFIGFLAVLFLEIRNVFSRFDPLITSWLQSVTPRVWDVPLSLFSILGSFEITSFLVLIIALWVFRRQRRIFYSLVFFGMILVFELVGKLFLFHPGPPPSVFRYSLPFVFPAVHVTTDYSFPSGHVSRTVFLAVVASVVSLQLVANRALSRLLVTKFAILAIIMVVSRIYLGEHWASDTLGGILLGGAMGFFAVSYYDAKDKH